MLILREVKIIGKVKVKQIGYSYHVLTKIYMYMCVKVLSPFFCRNEKMTGGRVNIIMEDDSRQRMTPHFVYFHI